MRLHGYITSPNTFLSFDNELTQGWFTNLRSMYDESDIDEIYDEYSNKRKKTK